MSGRQQCGGSATLLPTRHWSALPEVNCYFCFNALQTIGELFWAVATTFSDKSGNKNNIIFCNVIAVLLDDKISNPIITDIITAIGNCHSGPDHYTGRGSLELVGESCLAPMPPGQGGGPKSFLPQM